MIRPFEDEDAPAVVALWDLVFPDDPPHNAPREVIRRKLEVQRELFLVALAGTAVVGTVLAGYDGARGWVHHLAVHPDHRDSGIGRALMAAAEAGLAALGCPKLNLQVRAGNEQVLAFYEKMGFEIEERVSLSKHLDSSRSGSPR